MKNTFVSFKLKTTLTITLAALVALMASCTIPNQSRYMPPPVQSQTPQTIADGQWVGKEGFVSNFANGQFKTTTSDTGQMLAVGTYREVTNNVIEIDLTSTIRHTRSLVNCAIVSDYLMNCTPSHGTQFSLYKPSAAPFGFTLDSTTMSTVNTQMPALPQQPTGPTQTAPIGQLAPVVRTPSLTF